MPSLENLMLQGFSWDNAYLLHHSVNFQFWPQLVTHEVDLCSDEAMLFFPDLDTSGILPY